MTLRKDDERRKTMNNLRNIPGINLRMFDGAGAGGSAAAASSSGEGASAVSQKPSQSSKGAEEKVLYGKQPMDEPSGEGAAQAAQEINEEPATMEEFEELIKGRYKDMFAQKTQSIINERFKAAKQNEKAIKEKDAILDEIMLRYNITDGDTKKLLNAMDNDKEYWERVADEQGLTVEQAKQMRRMELENATFRAQAAQQQRDNAIRQIYDGWNREAEILKGKIEGFDLAEECKNKDFVDLISRGVEMESAYKVVHFDDEQRKSAAAAEKKVADSIRAGQARPAENGLGAGSGIKVKSDVSKLTAADRKEIARRVARGETITF